MFMWRDDGVSLLNDPTEQSIIMVFTHTHTHTHKHTHTASRVRAVGRSSIEDLSGWPADDAGVCVCVCVCV